MVCFMGVELGGWLVLWGEGAELWKRTFFNCCSFLNNMASQREMSDLHVSALVMTGYTPDLKAEGALGRACSAFQDT